MVAAAALEARASSSPRCQTPILVSVSALTVDDGAPGQCDPRTSEGRGRPGPSNSAEGLPSDGNNLTKEGGDRGGDKSFGWAWDRRGGLGSGSAKVVHREGGVEEAEIYCMGAAGSWAAHDSKSKKSRVMLGRHALAT